MRNLLIRFNIQIASLLMCALLQFVIVDLAISQDRDMTGNYRGSVFLEKGAKKVVVGLRVTALGDGEYKGMLYFGGLPGEQQKSSDDFKSVELNGSYTDFTLRLKGDFPLVFQFIHNRFTALDAKNSYKGHLEKVIRIDTTSSSN